MNLKPSEHRPRLHRTGLVATTDLSHVQVSKRRSNRMALSARVGLSGEDRQKCTFTMPAKATNLNRHGAAVQLTRDLQVGSVVTVRNQFGTQISARVVSQLPSARGVPTYAIEFVETDDSASNFWGISFPSTA